MIETVECNGQPRDMGCDQGRVLGERIRDAVERVGLPLRRSRIANLRPFVSGRAKGAGTGRELVRHFTHLGERIDGLARYADVDVQSIFELHERAARCEPGGEPLSAPASAVAGVGLAGASGVGVLRGLPARADAPVPYVLRRSRPEVGFASVEVTLPWLVTALAGVNTAGVCVALAPQRGWPGGLPAAAPSHLLVQECLQRFEDVGACIDWCLKRPVLGDGTLVLADARGRVATVEFDGESRSVDDAGKGPVGADASGPWASVSDPGDSERLLGLEAGGLELALDADAKLLSLRRIGDDAEKIVVRA